jgi:copper(I)-binding protein
MKTFIAAMVVLALGGLSTHACTDKLEIKNPWIVAVPPNAKATAAFMTFVNKGTEKLEIVGGSCEVAGKVEPMISTHDDGMAGMMTVPALTVPAEGEAVLKPGGDHIMLMELKRVPKEGETLKLTLKLSTGCETTIEVPVLKKAPK